MPEHYNLYYLLLEDQQNNAMSETRSQQIRQTVELHYRRLHRSGEEKQAGAEEHGPAVNRSDENY